MVLFFSKKKNRPKEFDIDARKKNNLLKRILKKKKKKNSTQMMKEYSLMLISAQNQLKYFYLKVIDLFKLTSRKNDSEANFNLGIIYLTKDLINLTID
mgnify:CR=1 FL=1